MKVKILGAKLKSYWYADKIGVVYEVVDKGDNFEVINLPEHMIGKDDCEVVQEVTKKPPIGLRPEFIVLEHRQKEIQEAVTRYMEAGWAIPSSWTAEYYRNNSRLLEIK
jgi:hypothetical protein